MASSLHFRRLFALGFLIAMVFVGLGVRLVFLQHVSHEKYARLASKNTTLRMTRQARRGDILDRQGNPLALSIPVKRLYADPTVIGGHRASVAQAMAPLLDYDPVKLEQKLTPVTWETDSGRIITNQHVNLRRVVSVDQWTKIKAALGELRFHPEGVRLTQRQKDYYKSLHRFGIYSESDQKRVYPSGRTASHVLGFAQSQSTEFSGHTTSIIQGRSGIESAFNDKLRGLEGWKETETDVYRRELTAYRKENVEPEPGLNVVLTLDMVVQQIVEAALAEGMQNHTPLSVSSVVVRPATGEILAMASLPDFDPNFAGDAEISHRRNRVISDQMEPGSTFKIVPVSGAMNDGLIGMSDRFHCENGRWLFHGKTLKDHHGYGMLDVADIIMKSSNIGAAKIGIRMGKQRLYDYVRGFGFGERTGVTLLGEVPGTVHHPKVWDKLTISRLPMGHAVAVTHLQMVMAMSAIANKGRLMRPMLVKRLVDAENNVYAEYEPQMVRQVVSESVAKKMVAALERVVSKDGTAPQAALELYRVAAKTGTAQKPGRRVYLAGQYVTSFIGFFPAEEPEVCISIVFDVPRNGYYGGAVAGPVFKRIAEQVAQYLKIRPDVDTELKGAVTGL